MRRYYLLISAVLLLSPVVAVAEEIRAIWITRYDYKTAKDVKAIVAHCAELGCNRVIFQVRGNADAFYKSKLEPWGLELGGKDPGFDPLSVAIAEARSKKLKIEAWINVLPLWKGIKAPKNRAHPFLKYPDWRVIGSDGQRQKLNKHYVCVNPARPDVRAHIVAVSSDIARRYDIDALHLDYIRYVTDLEKTIDFSHDAVTLKKFGKDPVTAAKEWAIFKKKQVTELVRAIRKAVKKARPSCTLNAAVFPTAESRERVFQDAEGWVREGLIEVVYPMIYSIDEKVFKKRLFENLALFKKAKASVPVVPGIGLFKHPTAQLSHDQIRMVRKAGCKGVSLFCYASFFNSSDQKQLKEKNEALKKQRIELIKQLFRRG
jgi:uncharacterized lipoprotein YddW (UPF0748 family)